jgi:hypothetical protein
LSQRNPAIRRGGPVNVLKYLGGRGSIGNVRNAVKIYLVAVLILAVGVLAWRMHRQRQVTIKVIETNLPPPR